MGLQYSNKILFEIHALQDIHDQQDPHNVSCPNREEPKKLQHDIALIAAPDIRVAHKLSI